MNTCYGYTSQDVFDQRIGSLSHWRLVQTKTVASKQIY